MDKVNDIINSSKFNKYINRLETLEKNRKFCKHGIEHLLDVSRIAYIKSLEDGLGLSKEVIYGAALLHDLGRVLEYEENIPHNIAGVKIAEEILEETDFTKNEKTMIINSILKHRKDSEDSSYYKCAECDSKLKERILSLSKIIKESDKISRCCFNCKATNECYWDESKKNKGIIY